MSIRTRTASLPGGEGTYYRYFFGTVDSGSVQIPGFTGTCTDVVDGTRNDHPLAIHKVTHSNGTFSGVKDGGVGLYHGTYVDYSPAFFRGTVFGHLGLPPINDAADATKAFARTNPSRTVVDLPGFIGELRELPALFNVVGKHLLKTGANAYLSYQFGWKPLINDLKGFLDFQAHVMKRERELQNLFNKGGLKRTFQVSRDAVNSKSSGLFLESYLFQLLCDEYVIETNRHRWATARWSPTVDSVPKTDAELHKLAVEAVYGLSVNGHTAWNLIPFSWLADWASSFGDYLDSSRNSVGAACSGVNLMTHTKTTHRFGKVSLLTGGTWSGVRLPAGTVVVEDKQRSFSLTPSITASLPFITGKKMSILGALGIQRLRGIH